MSVATRDGQNWTHDEVVIALGLYFQIPWGKINQHNPVIIQAAKLLGRTPASLGRKMGNLGRFVHPLTSALQWMERTPPISRSPIPG